MRLLRGHDKLLRLRYDNLQRVCYDRLQRVRHCGGNWTNSQWGHNHAGSASERFAGVSAARAAGPDSGGRKRFGHGAIAASFPDALIGIVQVRETSAKSSLDTMAGPR